MKGTDIMTLHVSVSRLTADDIQENSLIPLRFVKYQNVQNLTVRFDSSRPDVVTFILQTLFQWVSARKT